MSAEAPFFSPPACLSWLLLGLVVRRKSSWGFLENECWLPFSQLNTRRLTLLKTSTSASGLGQRERGREKKKARKRHFITFQKFKLKVGLFWHKFMKFQLQNRRVLTAFHWRPLFRSARGYHIRQEGEWKETQAIIGSEAWM